MAATLLMFSGGIDSTAALHKLLTESDDDLYVHHIDKHDAESRHHAEAEARAVEAIVRHCQSRYRPFTFSRSGWQFGLAYHGWNLTLCAFVGAQVIRSYGDKIDRYAVGTHQSDVMNMSGDTPGGFGDGARRMQEALGVFYACFGTSERRSLPTIHWPLKDLTRQQVVDSLPEDLLALTWSCRHPVRQADNSFAVCGECISCKSLQEIDGLHRSFSPPANSP